MLRSKPRDKDNSMKRMENLKTRKEFLKALTLLGASAALGSVYDCSGLDYGEESLRLRKTSTSNVSTDPKLELIRYAILAPSSHNSQPWKFSMEDNTIRIFPDLSRRLPFVDPQDRELYISIGCALENLVVAAKALGFESQIESFPKNEPKECIRIRLLKSKPVLNDPLFLAIPKRQSTRNEYDGKPVPSEDLKRLELDSKHSLVRTVLFTDQNRMNPLVEWIREGDRLQIAEEGYVVELKQWIRFNENEALRKGDGLLTLCNGGPSIPTWVGNILFSLVLSGPSQAEADAKLARSSSGFVVFVSEKDDRNDWIETGRSFERWALAATSKNIKCAFFNQPIEVPSIRAQLQTHLNVGKNFPQLVARFGYSNPMPYSPRRSLQDILL
ncbi:hypothetical protein CH370_00820 [Leptospira kmetyi]|nr:hypothetical protein CH370_00820 [Leptospira kmetyi]